MTGPAEEPVSIIEAKDHLSVDHDLHDAQIARLIGAARQWAEGRTKRAFVTQTWRARLTTFPNGGISFYPSPLQSITSLVYLDTLGVSTTWGAGNYSVYVDRDPGILALAYNVSWPSLRDQADAITITYVVGYGTSNDVPEAIKQAILLKVGDLYANRESSIVGVSYADNPTACALLEPYTLRYLR